MEMYILFIQQLQNLGPDHNKTFTVELSVNGEKKTIGVGSSKKEAEMNAAKELLERM